tara:strand:+ start:340 stop:534 length:195 start_codon:yes stop_codon:yes gene_type:complete
MGKEHKMKHNGKEYIESGLGGHPRFSKKNGGAVSVNLACDEFFKRQNMERLDFRTFQQPTKRTK